MNIVDAFETDWPEVRRIYADGIATGNATFTRSPPSTWQDWHSHKIDGSCLVAKENGRTIGWASLEKTSERVVYSGVAIVNIYVAVASQSRGIGSGLMDALIRRSEELSVWTLEARIFPENTASIRLHEKYGFTRVGVRERLGRMEYGIFEGKWRDVVLLERRSATIGVK